MALHGDVDQRCEKRNDDSVRGYLGNNTQFVGISWYIRVSKGEEGKQIITAYQGENLYPDSKIVGGRVCSLLRFENSLLSC
jgi:hypothetical protein